MIQYNHNTCFKKLKKNIKKRNNSRQVANRETNAGCDLCLGYVYVCVYVLTAVSFIPYKQLTTKGDATQIQKQST